MGYRSSALYLLLGLVNSGVAVAAEDRGTVNLQIENDLFASSNDRNFTNGIRLSYLSKAKTCHADAPSDSCLTGILHSIAALIPGYRQGESYRLSYSLGQNMYTPADIERADLIADDRPYAGWLYGGFGLVAKNSGPTYNRIDNLEVNIGVIGPASGAELIHTTWHKLFDFRPARGWHNQLQNEPGVVLLYERIWQFKRKSQILPGLEMELAPSVGAALGNVYTYAAAGTWIRIGANLPDDYGPPRIRPSLPGSDYFTPKDNRLGLYFFAGAEGRALARNIFLDGNTFTDSHSVNKKHFVGDLQLGLAVVGPGSGLLPPFRLAYTYVVRTKEFDSQISADQFGSINFSFNVGF